MQQWVVALQNAGSAAFEVVKSRPTNLQRSQQTLIQTMQNLLREQEICQCVTALDVDGGAAGAGSHKGDEKRYLSIVQSSALPHEFAIFVTACTSGQWTIRSTFPVRNDLSIDNVVGIEAADDELLRTVSLLCTSETNDEVTTLKLTNLLDTLQSHGQFVTELRKIIAIAAARGVTVGSHEWVAYYEENRIEEILVRGNTFARISSTLFVVLVTETLSALNPLQCTVPFVKVVGRTKRGTELPTAATGAKIVPARLLPALSSQ